MKNNLIIIFIICFFCFPNIVLSQSFTFKTKNIEILNEGNQVNAYEGKAISNDGNLEIKSDKFRYFKNSDVLRTNGNGELLIKSKNLRIRYDFESSEVPQPGNFAVGNLSSAALFGTAKFSQAVFGATTLPSKSILVTGSGFSNNFKFFSDDTNAPYSVNGMFVSFIAGGRR